MKVNLHATYRLVTGLKSVELEWSPGIDLGAALRGLAARCPRLLPELYAPDGTLFEHVHIFVNRRDVTAAAGSGPVLLGSDDVIDLFPPISGG